MPEVQCACQLIADLRKDFIQTAGEIDRSANLIDQE